MDIQQKRRIKGGQGNQASEYSPAHWFVRAGSWQYGAESSPEDIEAEKREEDLKYGTPHADVLDNCANRNPKDGPLPNPHNFSSNPGFLSSSTGDMATMGGPANGGTARIATAGSGRSLWRRDSGGTGTVGYSAIASQGNSVLPAPGDTNPGAEGNPQVVTSGYNNG